MLTPVKYSWRCTMCDGHGNGGAAAFATHYRKMHQAPKPTYIGYLIEARNELGLTGTDAYKWAHAAYAEYVNTMEGNQR